MRPDQTSRAAAALLGRRPDAVERVRGQGRNSGVYRVRAGDRVYALKQYPPHRHGERDRAAVEFAALRFLAENGIAPVPRPFAVDPAGYCLMEWIDGEAVDAPAAADIAAAADLLAAIHALRAAPGAETQPAAAEACTSGGEIVAQVERRLARLGALQGEPALATLLQETFRPLLQRIAEWSQAGYAAEGLDFDRTLDRAAQTLCPADFGFHNALRRAETGELAFIDFDYFGWDDPVKLTADFLLHPGMRLAAPLKHQFAAAAAQIFDGDPTFTIRLGLLYPLFGLRWAAILLNEFLPERWAHRLNAGGEADWQAAKQRQLDRAREWLHSLTANFQRFPYGK